MNGLVPLAAALRLVGDLPLPAGTPERVPLALAAGRVLAHPAVAQVDMPSFDTAAVDGWAVRLADLSPDAPTRLAVLGRIAAGEDATGRRVAGGALRVLTGAMVPADADAVVMQEQVRVEHGSVVVPPPMPQAGRHIRRRGEQARLGDLLLDAGRRLGPADLALAAGGGLDALAVRRPLRVALLCTGTELRAPGAPLPPGAVADQNGVMVTALLEAAGAAPVLVERLADAADALAARLRDAAAMHDLVVTTGGASVGDEDHVRGLLPRLGRVLVERLAIKPGRPTALGLIGTTPVLALPGPPAAAFTAFALFGEALVRHLQGRRDRHPAPQDATADFAAAAGDIALALPVTLHQQAGRTRATRCEATRGTLAALAAADGLAMIEAGRSVAPGDTVSVHRLAG